MTMWRDFGKDTRSHKNSINLTPSSVRGQESLSPKKPISSLCSMIRLPFKKMSFKILSWVSITVIYSVWRWWDDVFAMRERESLCEEETFKELHIMFWRWWWFLPQSPQTAAQNKRSSFPGTVIITAYWRSSWCHTHKPEAVMSVRGSPFSMPGGGVGNQAIGCGGGVFVVVVRMVTMCSLFLVLLLVEEYGWINCPVI